jgi:riboflavin kinase / FMN adenylyltransferase
MSEPRASLSLPRIADGAVVTVGTFDGVHLGHRDILARLAARGRELGLPTVLVTFVPHPLAVVNPSAAPHLLTPGIEQVEAIVDAGPPDYLVVLPFTRSLASYSAEQFVGDLLVARYRVRELIIGYDHGLGRGRQGDATVLQALGRQLGFGVEVVPATLGGDGLPLSSSAIRRAVAYGDLAGARAGLGRPYSIRGQVIEGNRRGRTIHFPTLNLQVDGATKLLPPLGVYAVRVESAKGRYGGMMNLGGRPTFGDEAVVPEVHLFGATGEWYGDSVRVELVRRLRDVVRFDGVEALVRQLEIDRSAAGDALTQD